MSDLRRAVKIAVAQRDLNLKGLAELMNVKPPALSVMISGNPTKDNIEKSAGALDLKASELLALGE